MNKINIGDFIKITGDPEGSLEDGFKDDIFKVTSLYSNTVEIDTSKYGGNKFWTISMSSVTKMKPTEIDCIQIGDIITDGEDFRMVLDIYGTNSVDVSTTEDEILDIEDLEYYLENGKYIHYFKQELKNNEYRIYYPEEKKDVEELTMEEVCEQLGKTIKIKK